MFWFQVDTVQDECQSLKVRTSVIINILSGDLDAFYFLRELKIEANFYLRYLQPGLFRNMSKLEQLSISYNPSLKSLQHGTFEGLTNLRNLTLVNNDFRSIASLAILIKPNILPSLKGLDISENPFGIISEKDLAYMDGSILRRLEINLCNLEYIHPDAFLPLKMLDELYIRQNYLNASLLGEILTNLHKNGINLTFIDLSGMGLRKQPPRKLMEIIATTTISRLILADNHFEVITDDTFPIMSNIRELDLRRIFAMYFGADAFDTIKFPHLQVLLLSQNNLHGFYQINRPTRGLLVLDLSSNGDLNPESDNYYCDIGRNTFVNFRKLRVLYLAYNAIRAIYDYTFKGLENLRILNLENTCLYFVGEKTFKPMRHLELLNLANNPFGRLVNLTGSIFEGLEELKVLVLKNCSIENIKDTDNLFESMSNITTLVLRKNLLRYVTAETFKHQKKLEILDLRENMLASWWEPLFFKYRIHPHSIYLEKNKITHFTLNMLLDLNYLLENRSDNHSLIINFTDNVFVCDCNSMYQTYLWLKVNGPTVNKFFYNDSQFLCGSPDVWENHRVAEFLEAVPNMRCAIYIKATNTLLLIWSAPTLVTIILVILLATLTFKYRIYISYWIFVSKIALGRRFIRKSVKADPSRRKNFKYDAFVSYSSDDNEFVALMLSKLELTPPSLKLCVYERDFEIGSFIAESVSNSIDESRYVILVISNSFAKSQWCRWETQAAEYHRLFLEDGTSYDPLVLIKIGDIETKYLTITLKYLLRTKIYHLWNEQQSDEFWVKLKKVLMKK